ncbi:hypothetical protein [Actinomadura sp. 9N407]|uniref:hypothetical protein n=1 Tax=Actinomadura sp. 9N407 TaxID=3375154 RepID=UPI0037A827E4
MKRAHRLRQVVNVCNLSTPLGLLLARIAARHLRRGPDGLYIAGGYRPPVPVASAFTLGNVVLVRRDAESLLARPALLRHEARHSTQYAYCLGPVMLPPYLLCAGISLLLCGDHASYNPFERLAGLDDGGYARRPLRFRRR